MKSTKYEIKIPRSNRPKIKNTNPGPGAHNINLNSIRRKTPSAQIVMDQVDRMVKLMNESAKIKMADNFNVEYDFDNSIESKAGRTARTALKPRE